MPFLQNPVNKLHLVGDAAQKALNKLGIQTIADLLYHFPRDWQDLSRLQKISEITPGQLINLRARMIKLGGHRTPRRRMYLTESMLEDDTGTIQAVWYNQPYLKNILKTGQEYYFSGKAVISPYGKSKSHLVLQNPAFELVKSETIHTAGIVPLYDLTEGVTQKQIRYFLSQTTSLASKIPDLLPDELRKRLHLPTLEFSLKNIHFPKDQASLKAARGRLSFEELFVFQLALLSFKNKIKTLPAPQIPIQTGHIKKFVAALPFSLTASQRLAVWEILKDLSLAYPMNRLLEGEVGSGKTVVAGIAMFEVAVQGYQSVILAPTEILAWQHYQTLKNLFKDINLEMALLTRSRKIGEISDIANGQTKIIIGTHALLQEQVKFDKIGLLVIDEQHRFGVNQRAKLARGSSQMEPPINAENNFLYKDLTYQIRGAIFEVYNQLGPGHKEIIYQKALVEELKRRDLRFETEKSINVKYAGKNIGTYKPDMIIENKVILEIKALTFIGQLEEKQIWHYLKGSDHKLALLVNFGSKELQIKRIVYDTARDQRGSAPNQRQSALEVPHLLSMSATPIPRTLALAFYGDLDISMLKELPKGRKKVITRLVEPEKRSLAYEFIRKHLLLGQQAYFVMPLIESSPLTPLPLGEGGHRPGEGVKAVLTEEKKLKEVFPEFQIGLLHGRLPGEEKKEIMDQFKSGRYQILISTSVVEVGVDVANAAFMVIENAERFGLSQLHQLRGRVGRSHLQSFCLLFAENLNEYTKSRLMAVVNSNDGFELAEKDLELRGAGEIMGTRQSGFIPFKIAKLSDRKTIKLARAEAEKLLAQDQDLQNYPLLRQKIGQIAKETHLE